jgi:hypothetical protein
MILMTRYLMNFGWGRMKYNIFYVGLRVAYPTYVIEGYLFAVRNPVSFGNAENCFV